MNSPIIFPIFLECAKYTLDSYWKEIFNNCAHNKFPQGIKFDSNAKNFIISTKKNKEIIPLIKDPIQLFQLLMNIFKNKFEMKSTRETKFQKDKINKIKKRRDSNLDCEWKKIKPKNLKDQLIYNYIDFLEKKYNLNTLEVRNLLSVIQLGFQFRTIQPDHVNYSNGIVHGIKGLVFNKDKRLFKIKNKSVKTTKNDKSSLTNKFYSMIDKFVKEYTIKTKL